MKIAICNQKGGVGKSTLCINLALAVAGLKTRPTVGLVDIDEQRSCVETLEGHKRDNLFLYETTEKPHETIQGLDHEIVFCDLPPHSHELMYQAAAVSDLALVPLKPSPLDVRAAVRTIGKLKIIQEKFNPDLQLRFLVNMLTPRTIIGNEIREVLERLYPDVPIMKTMVHERQIYKQSLTTGESVIEFDKRGPAAKELASLVDELVKIIKVK